MYLIVALLIPKSAKVTKTETNEVVGEIKLGLFILLFSD